ncbi:protein Njmu-R1-like isoform X1 [Physella acuta]|uniref:protein Njmu-R1-like isoform X1 n=1 Tax=Physella acuta TaxID=109671 RepID=UPI0027DC5CF7|nr:protein Njmu-R1-like isoform X1 [Physella acuta]
MADSTSDSGSVHSLQAENQALEKKSDSSNRFYALYSYYPHRVVVAEEESKAIPNEDQTDGSLSLNIAATNLNANAETDLRKSLFHKLLKYTSGDALFFSVGLQLAPGTAASASCFCSLVAAASDSLGFDHVAADDSTDVLSLKDRQQFVVCFISFQDGSLDIFKSEFDSYIQDLVPLLDKEPLPLPHPPPSNPDISNNSSSPAPCSLASQEKLSQLSTRIHRYLEQWPELVLGYVTRTVQYFGNYLQHFLHAALSNASLHICGATPEEEEDVKRFFGCCSLSKLFEKLQPDNVSVIDSNDNNDLWQLQPLVITITFQEGRVVSFDKSYSCQFCVNAAEKLMKMDLTNASRVRDFLEQVKLTFVQSLNKLKRFLNQAELDYYALYRSLSFLKKCGCGDLLLRYVKLDGGPEALNVLSVLETFIVDMKQTLL